MGDWLDRLNIQQKIMACFSLSFFLCLFLLGIVLNRMISTEALDRAQKSAVEQMRQMDASLVSFERILKTDFMRLSKNGEMRQGSGLTIYAGQTGNENGLLEMKPEAKGGFELRAYQIFQDFAKSHEKITAAVVYGMWDGGYVQYPAVTRENNYDPRQTYWYKDGMAAGESGLLYVSPPFQGASGKPVIGFYSLVWSYGEEPLGVLGLQLDLAALMGMILPEDGGNQADWMVLDSENAILVDARHPDAAFRKIADANLGDISLMAQKDEGISRIILDGEEKYAVIHLSTTTKLKYIRLLDGDQVMSGARNVRMSLGLMLLLAMVLGFFGSRWLALRITAPFRAMEERAEAIGEGKLRAAEDLAESDDEVGRLALVFQEMAESLRGRLESLKDGAGKLAGTSGAMVKEVQSCREAAKTAMEQTAAMTATEEKYGKTVGEVADQMAGMAESLAGASEGVKEIGRVTHQLGLAASDGHDGLRKALEGLKGTKERTGAAISVAETLDKKALQSIEHIKSIGEMSEQLNLLALNAAVESARSGSSKERSKFTAVAEEVRQLSEQSSKAARKALLVISALQQEAQQAAGAVKEAEDAILSCESCVQQRDGEFQRLEDELGRIDKILEEAASSIQSLEGCGKRTKAAAEQVEWSARKSADAAESVAKAVEEQAKSLEKLEQLSGELTEGTEMLKSRMKGLEV